MHDLNFALKQLCLSNRDGSFSTQSARLRSLNLIANQLHLLGFRHLLPHGLKPKHVFALLDLWNSQALSPATIKNRMSHIRWWSIKVLKPGIVPNSNSKLHIPPRSYTSNLTKAVSLPSDSLDLISDPFIKLSLQLQAAFGLRREESIKFIPSWADKGNSIVLKGSWCKGGQQREVPITNHLQRDILDIAHKLAGNGSLIPSNRSYIQQLKVYESQCLRAGLHKLHGLRHKYAQDRFFHLTGCPSSASLNNSSNSSPTSSPTSSGNVGISPNSSNHANDGHHDCNNSNPISLLSDQRYIASNNTFSSSNSISIAATSIPLFSSASSGISSSSRNIDNSGIAGSTSISAPAPAPAPVVTSLPSKLSPEQKSIHKSARLTISKELGHHRLAVTSVYLGKPYK